MIKALAIAACLVGLASCGPMNNGSLGRTATDLVTSIVTGKDATAKQPSPELANARPEDVQVITINSRALVAPMVRIGRNGTTETWRADEGFTVSIDQGVIVGTRGLGFDLMGVDVTGLQEAIAAGGGTSNRVHAFLNSRDQLFGRTMECAVTRVGPEDLPTLTGGTRTLIRYNEACKGRTVIFENKFWTNEDGAIVRSSQVVSPRIGFVTIEGI